jgi:hypothetical protein
MEIIDPAFIVEYGDNGGGDIIAAEIKNPKDGKSERPKEIK